jgi:HD-GYP domain-containing protein (c-di-GMP phosphodiesterase class II)
MKFVPAKQLKAGMVLAKNLYDYSNNLMLSKRNILTETEINRIQQLKYIGLYIFDDIYDIDYNDVISEGLKTNAVQTIKKAFLQADNPEENVEVQEHMKGIVCDIVDEIVKNKSASLNIMELKNFDDYTYEHCVNVCVYSILLGIEAGLNKKKLYELGLGAILHDIGKIFVPKDILEKPGKLNLEEFNEIKKHCILGSEYLKEKWHIDSDVRLTVLTHHERQDGHGYPLGLAADKQTFFGKIVAITDVYDALTSDRPYRKAVSPSEAIEHIMGNTDILFDPKIVELFMQKIVPYPTGTLVRLSNGFKGVVLENHKKFNMRPTVKIIPEEVDDNYDTDFLQKIIIYDLYNDSSLFNITITGVITNEDIIKMAK